MSSLRKFYLYKNNKRFVANSKDNKYFIKEYLRIIESHHSTSPPLNFEITVLKKVNELNEGASFGELALVLDNPRTGTIFTKTP